MADLDMAWLREAVRGIAARRATAPMPTDDAFRAYLTGQMTADAEGDFREQVSRRAGAYERMLELAQGWRLSVPGLAEEGEEAPGPEVLLFPVRQLPGLRPANRERAALAAAGPGDVRVETHAEGTLAAALVIEPSGQLSAVVERGGVALAGAPVSLTLVSIGEGGKEVARGVSDAGGRVELGSANEFPRPTERQYYEVIVVCDGEEG